MEDEKGEDGGKWDGRRRRGRRRRRRRGRRRGRRRVGGGDKSAKLEAVPSKEWSVAQQAGGGSETTFPSLASKFHISHSSESSEKD